MAGEGSRVVVATAARISILAAESHRAFPLTDLCDLPGGPKEKGAQHVVKSG
jgi:hypothetical protein